MVVLTTAIFTLGITFAVPYSWYFSAAGNSSLTAGMFFGKIGYQFLDEKFKVQD